MGVSEGAGLSVLAATDPLTKTETLGVVGLGLPDLNELGWRWKGLADLPDTQSSERADLQRGRYRREHRADSPRRHPLDAR